MVRKHMRMRQHRSSIPSILPPLILTSLLPQLRQQQLQLQYEIYAQHSSTLLLNKSSELKSYAFDSVSGAIILHISGSYQRQKSEAGNSHHTDCVRGCGRSGFRGIRGWPARPGGNIARFASVVTSMGASGWRYCRRAT
jgi:hypothetical protein